MNPTSKIRALALSLPLLAYAGTALAMPYSHYDIKVGAVFTMTNAPDNNEILMFARDAHGHLSFVNAFPTQGNGTGSGLGNQSALSLSDNERWLFAVNAGSNEISVFKVQRDGLMLVNKVPSGGQRPVSLTVNRHLLYVLNAGSDSITGFYIRRNGKLTPLPNSTRPLSGVNTAPAQVSFSPDGDTLVVTEKATNLIDTYHVNYKGLPSTPIVNHSAGMTPFGFAFDRRGHLIVSEAAGGAVDASSLSSYRLSDDGSLEVISAAVPSTETAACWVVTSQNGRYAYTTNTASSSISGYRINRDGSLMLRDADGVTAETGQNSSPIDMALSRNGRFLYALSASNGTIAAYQINVNGKLVPLPGSSELPTGVNGLAAF